MRTRRTELVPTGSSLGVDPVVFDGRKEGKSCHRQIRRNWPKHAKSVGKSIKTSKIVANKRRAHSRSRAPKHTVSAVSATRKPRSTTGQKRAATVPAAGKQPQENREQPAPFQERATVRLGLKSLLTSSGVVRGFDQKGPTPSLASVLFNGLFYGQTSTVDQAVEVTSTGGAEALP